MPLATAYKNGLMSNVNAIRMGRRFSKGYRKLAQSPYWYYHYVAFIFVASPSSTNGVLLYIDWRGTSNIVKGIAGSKVNTKIYTGTNPSTNEHELWLGVIGSDGSGGEFMIEAENNCADLNTPTVDTLPSYVSEVAIS